MEDVFEEYRKGQDADADDAPLGVVSVKEYVFEKADAKQQRISLRTREEEVRTAEGFVKQFRIEGLLCSDCGRALAVGAEGYEKPRAQCPTCGAVLCDDCFKHSGRCAEPSCGVRRCRCCGKQPFMRPDIMFCNEHFGAYAEESSMAAVKRSLSEEPGTEQQEVRKGCVAIKHSG